MRIYIACPYSQGSVSLNVQRCIETAESIALAGGFPFAPLLNHYWNRNFEHDYEFWMRQTLEWLKVCDAVLRIPGPSLGADREVAYAVSEGIPVFFSTNEALSWLSRSIQQVQQMRG